MRAPPPAALSLVVAVSLGCASAPTTSAPPNAWIELRTTSLVLTTNFPEADARAAFAGVEGWYRTYKELALPGVTTRPFQTIQLRENTLPTRRAVMVGTSYLDTSTPRLHASPGAAKQMIGTQVDQLFGSPKTRWLASGLRFYLERGGPPSNGEPDRLYVGLAYPLWQAQLREKGPFKMAELRSGTPWQRNREGSYRATCWAVVHYLTSRHPRRLKELRALLAAGTEPDAAWDQAGLDDAEIDKELVPYALALDQSAWMIVAVKAAETPAIRVLPEPEVQTLRDRLGGRKPAP
jgi:hypothetical protein